MDVSRNISAVLGPTVMAATGLETLNFHIWEGIHPTTVFLNGMILFIVGLVVARFHNIWTRDWRLIVTLFGWLLVIAGFLRMTFPDAPQATAGTGTFVMIGLLFLAGAVISWKAYLTKAMP